jgi:predicted nucleotidyltransferase
MTRDQAEVRTILRGLVGSTVHGLNVQDGVEDRDEMGVLIEDLEHVVGFTPFEQYIYRSAAEREGRIDARSRAGDLDLVIYSLRKYLRLCLSGNPTMMLPLYVPEASLVTCTPRGRELRALAPALASRRAGDAFLGYLQSQKRRLLGEEGQMRVRRPELVARDGYDSKYAMHMCRLGYQGIEFMRSGRLTLPMPEESRAWLYALRCGEIPLQDMLTRATELEQELKDAIETSPLPARPDHATVEAWMHRQYRSAWTERAAGGNGSTPAAV